MNLRGAAVIGFWALANLLLQSEKSAQTAVEETMFEKMTKFLADFSPFGGISALLLLASWPSQLMISQVSS
jgi:hypothetical protein